MVKLKLSDIANIQPVNYIETRILYFDEEHCDSMKNYKEMCEKPCDSVINYKNMCEKHIKLNLYYQKSFEQEILDKIIEKLLLKENISIKVLNIEYKSHEEKQNIAEKLQDIYIKTYFNHNSSQFFFIVGEENLDIEEFLNGNIKIYYHRNLGSKIIVFSSSLNKSTNSAYIGVFHNNNHNICAIEEIGDCSSYYNILNVKCINKLRKNKLNRIINNDTNKVI